MLLSPFFWCRREDKYNIEELEGLEDSLACEQFLLAETDHDELGVVDFAGVVDVDAVDDGLNALVKVEHELLLLGDACGKSLEDLISRKRPVAILVQLPESRLQVLHLILAYHLTGHERQQRLPEIATGLMVQLF